MDKAIKKNFLMNKYTNTKLIPTKDNNFKILIPNVNIVENLGKNLIFLVYELCGIIILKVSGILLYLWF